MSDLQPHHPFAIVQAEGGARVFLLESPDVTNGWTEVTSGYVPGLFWSEIEELGGLAVLYRGRPPERVHSHE